MNNKSGKAISAVVRYLLLIAVSAVILVPFYWMITTSLKDQTKVFEFPMRILPSPAVWGNYAEVFEAQPDFLLHYWNSFYIAVVVTVGTCLFAAIAGFAFAKIKFPLRSVWFLVLLSGMMIPAEVTTIPNFIWFSKLQLADTHFPLIVPPMLGAGGIFGVFLLRQFFITVPNELDEAAEIDGCSPWTTFWRIMVPLAAPAFATLSIFTFLNSWEDFLDPMIYISSSDLFTLPIAMKLFTDTAGTAWHLLMAASVMATLPLLLVFFFAQRKFIDGIATTGLK
ncbi:carbohydrate ABC transporter permease [Cohnella thailandensis]|uniref:Carbohydrate ABC transporter permease n=1 Tax=Cohnella thailandensis TaxID=557557 RepID=A0A841T0K8_9BACL|nr:carbohydrate ABC transporter permease [Cohnella thailandensis]MBB6637694.1 carbohydrate ABC transporter permease [Cohnella thailandensis]MBP1974129.1 multiple sugar transport system permease protein [Cohnella thailandensis]